MGNIYILKRKGMGFCLSKFQSLSSIDDILTLNGENWFTLKDIKEALLKEYKLDY